MAENDGRDALRLAVKSALAFYDYSKRITDTCDFFPEHVHIEPTNACNLRCVHCHQSGEGGRFTKQRGMMDFSVYQKIIDEIKNVSGRVTLNQHGEPLLHPNILDMVNYAKKSGLSVSLLTNATKLTEDISNSLIKMGLNRIVFSFEGSNQATHEAVRVGSDYSKTLQNILNFIRLNYENGRPVFICMSMVDSSYSHEDIENYQAFFNSLPINTIFVNPMLNMSGATKTSKEIDMSRFADIPRKEAPICRMPWENIAVNWDGLVSACVVDFNEDHIIGDVKRENLQNIFNSERMRKFRRCHIDRDFQWIEEQGALCATCNCRFDPEYDLRNLEDFTVNYIVRQAEVAAPRLCLKNEQANVDPEEKYNNLIKILKGLEDRSESHDK